MENDLPSAPQRGAALHPAPPSASHQPCTPLASHPPRLAGKSLPVSFLATEGGDRCVFLKPTAELILHSEREKRNNGWGCHRAQREET